MVTLNNSISSTQGNYFADLIEGVSTVLQYRAMKHHSFAYWAYDMKIKEYPHKKGLTNSLIY